MSWLLLIPALLTVWIIWGVILVFQDRFREMNKPRPTYFVQHPDGTFTKADPQP